MREDFTAGAVAAGAEVKVKAEVKEGNSNASNTFEAVHLAAMVSG